MQTNIPGGDLGIGFIGGVKANGVPAHVQSGHWPGLTAPGILDKANTEIAYLGRIVSSDPATPGLLEVGWAPGQIVRGPILNRQGVRENDPAKPDYLLNEQPADAVTKGPLQYASWGTGGSGTRDVPELGDQVIFNETTGEIEFLPDGSAIPAGYKPLLAAVEVIDLITQIVTINFEPQSYASFPTEEET